MKLKRELANLLCLYRIIGSLTALFAVGYGAQIGLGTSLFYSSMLISDLFDGYFYRKFAKDHPPKHWFNQLPISLDPTADLVFTLSGVAAIGIAQAKPVTEIIATLLTLGVIAAWLNLILQNTKGFARSLATAILTYGWFCLMLVVVFFIWRLAGQIFGFVVTIVIFYGIFLIIVPKERWRRF